MNTEELRELGYDELADNLEHAFLTTMSELGSKLNDKDFKTVYFAIRENFLGK